MANQGVDSGILHKASLLAVGGLACFLALQVWLQHGEIVALHERVLVRKEIQEEIQKAIKAEGESIRELIRTIHSGAAPTGG